VTVRGTIRASLRLLDPRDRRLLWLATALQMATALLDFLGVVLVGLAGTLSLAMVAGNSPPSFVTALASAVGLGGLTDGKLLAVFAGVAAAFLLAKSIVSPLLLARVFRFLARREAMVSARLTKELLSRPLSFIQQRSTQETARALIRGPNNAIGVVLGQMVVGLSELALLALLTVPLLLINPAVALVVIAFLAVLTWGLQRALGSRAARFGTQSAQVDDLLSLRTVQEALGAYREITVADRRSFYVDRLRNLRDRSTQAAVGTRMVGMLPKYVSEAALVVGALALAAVLFSTQPIAVAAGTFAVFLAAATRLVPALLRLQSAVMSIRAAAGPAAPTYSLAADLERKTDQPEGRRTHPGAYLADSREFVPSISLQHVSYAYSPEDEPALRDITLQVAAGQTVALVGRSGAGKSTLADVILGVLEPTSGQVLVGGVEPGDAVSRWPGAVAYVPQTVMMLEASVRANVALGWPETLVDDDLVWEALRRAQLAEFVQTRPEGLDTLIGERGLGLSGGQRQRLGIARALFSRPRLLVLDEATSALDAETEKAITALLDDLDEGVTVAIIAHRLSTVQHADLVVYLEDGIAAAVGKFPEVRSQIPALDRQAELMGLNGPATTC
jgi:ABC-type multidrug transport system fused ATPase/permease subunit